MSDAEIFIPAPVGGWRHELGGLNLRDWFAGQALTYALDVAMGNGTANVPAEKLAAQIAYSIADAMLAARKGDTK